MIGFVLYLVGSLSIAAASVRIGVMLRRRLRRAAARRARREREANRFADAVEQAISRHFDESADLPAWDGWRRFEVRRKVVEAEGVCSFYLRPSDSAELPAFVPGQYLRLRVPVESSEDGLIRCYSLSDRPRSDHYRITVKRCLPTTDGTPPGAGSAWLIDHVDVGHQLDVQAPIGRFCLTDDQKPLVFLAGGIGVTPILSMLNHLVESRSSRDVWFFYGIRGSHEIVMPDHLRAIARSCPNIRIHLCYSDAGERTEIPGTTAHESMIDVDLLRRLLPLRPFEFYICGPDAMMDALTVGLQGWGVPPARIHTEFFGADSVSRATHHDHVPGDRAVDVVFARSGQTVRWIEGDGSLLDLAQDHGIRMQSGCRNGHCGSCMTAVKSGRVRHICTPSLRMRKGSCLACIASPETDIVIDA